MDSERSDLWTFDVQQIIQQLNIRQLSEVINQSLFNWVDPCDLRGFWLQLEPAPQSWDNAWQRGGFPICLASANVRTRGRTLTYKYSKYTLIICDFSFADLNDWPCGQMDLHATATSPIPQ